MRHDCYFCHIRTIEKLIAKFEPNAGIAEKLICSVHQLIASNWETANPKLATEIHRLAKRYLCNTNLYAEEKQNANEMLLENYPYWKALVNNSANPFFAAAKLAVIGNIIDYAVHGVAENISGQIEFFYQKDFKISMLEKLRHEVAKAESVLYLGDNCGEVVFDKLFIETMNHPNVTFVARGMPVINDVTLEDAKQVGIDAVCRVISNGADAPSTLLELCPDEFVEEFNSADLVISKGQGNFEGLMESGHPNAFFLLMAKCSPIAQLLGVNVNDLVATT